MMNTIDTNSFSVRADAHRLLLAASSPRRAHHRRLISRRRLAKAFARVQTIDARAERVGDIDQLRNLQAAYGYYVDKALWDDVVDLFADDGTMELGFNGVYAGQEQHPQISLQPHRRQARAAPGEINNHFQLSPVITLARGWPVREGALARPDPDRRVRQGLGRRLGRRHLRERVRARKRRVEDPQAALLHEVLRAVRRRLDEGAEGLSASATASRTCGPTRRRA